MNKPFGIRKRQVLCVCFGLFFFEFFCDARETASRRATNVLRGCHGGINVLCARVCPGEVDIVASGGADKSLLVSVVVKD